MAPIIRTYKCSLARDKNLFRQQYSKIGNTREQLFHAWRSFNFDENAETIDAYATHIRQVATLLGYGEPQILEVFKFPMEDLRQAVETAKRILIKVKLDRQLTGQSLSSPFMSIRDGHHRKVSFDTIEELCDKIDNLAVMIGKLATRESGTNRQFKPQIHQSRGRGQNRSYSQRSHLNRYRQNNRSNSRGRVQYRQDRMRPRYESRYEQNYRRGNFRGNVRNYCRENSTGEYRNNYRDDSYGRSRNRSSERLFSRNYGNNRTRGTFNSRSRSGSRASTNRDKICCYRYREYNHFTRDCPTSREEREVEQLQRMLNLGEEQTVTPPMSDTQEDLIRMSSEENLRANHLNL